jgi:hypothetical protein
MRVLCALLLAGLAGCATMVDGGPYYVTIRSRPDGADLRVDGDHVGRTPMKVLVSRSRSGHRIEMTLAGYVSYDGRLVDEDNPWAPLSLLTIVGVYVDIATGADRRPVAEQPTIVLAPAEPAQ